MNRKHKKRDKDNSSEENIPRGLLKKIKRIELRSRQLVSEAISGGYNSVFRGYGMEFEEVREYFPGDDYRRIDWNVTARHSTPYVKRFKEERQLNVLLLIDASGSLEYGSGSATKGERLAETAAVLSFAALSNQDKIGALFFTDIIERIIVPSINKNTILRLIREILFLKPCQRGTDINIAIEYAIKTMKRRGIIFILSDFFADIDYKKLFIATKKHDIIPVIFKDPFEDAPINIGLVDMIDNETGTMKLVDTGSPAYKRSITDRKNRRDSLMKELATLKIEPLEISTDGDVEQEIITYFEKRKKKIRL
jgi:uncharacterized protein (DUF58 family)